MINNQVKFKKVSPFFLEEVPATQILFTREDYELRIQVLMERMQQRQLDFVVIYGDREHFSNLEYFCGMDCRFEEALLVFGADGSRSVIVGNEGVSQTYQIPYPINVYLYQNFSLPGQPRDKQKELHVILGDIGISAASRVGLAGWKYFEQAHTSADPSHAYMVPAFIVDELTRAARPELVTDFTRELIGYPGGIRMQLRTAKEIAWVENASNRTAGVMQRILKQMKPGMYDTDVAVIAGGSFDPLNVYPMVHFGAERVRIGVGSPVGRQLQLGEVCGFCYSCRGSLTSRVGIAAYDEQSADPELRAYVDFYKTFWYAVTRWAELARVGANCADLYDAVMAQIGAPEYGVTLNPTHSSGTEEWSNSPVFRDSPYVLEDGAHIQVDIIASKKEPVLTAICEDCVVIAGEALRKRLKEEYPAAAHRIEVRQRMIREVLGIQIHDDLLPMSNLTFAYNPFLLNREELFSLA